MSKISLVTLLCFVSISVVHSFGAPRFALHDFGGNSTNKSDNPGQSDFVEGNFTQKLDHFGNNT